MPKQQILVADADPRSLRVIEVSLRKAGYTVMAASDGLAALEVALAEPPDLLVCDPQLPRLDGYALVRRFKEDPERAGVPVLFLAAPGAVEDRIRGLELGIEDWLSKPVFVRELLARVSLALGRKTQDAFARSSQVAEGESFSGSTRDMSVLDLLQTFELSSRSGRIVFRSTEGPATATLWLSKGQLVDAEVSALRGEEAVYRLFVWGDATFEAVAEPVTREPTIDVPTQTVVLEALRRADEWGRLVEQLPPLVSRWEIDQEKLAPRRAEIPAELDGMLRLLDGRRTLVEVVDQSPFEDLSTLSTLAKIYFEGLLTPSNATPIAPQVVGSRTVKMAAMTVPVAEAPSVAAHVTSFDDVPDSLVEDVPDDAPTAPPPVAMEAPVTSPVLASAESDTPSPGLAAETWEDEADDVAGVPAPSGMPLKKIAATVAAAVLGAALMAGMSKLGGTKKPAAETNVAPPAVSVAAALPPEPREAAPEAAPAKQPEPAPAPAPEPTPAPAPVAEPAAAREPEPARAPAEPARVATAAPAPEPVAAAKPAADVDASAAPEADTGAPLTLQAQQALERGKPTRALELAQRAVRSSPANADAWLTLGAAQQALGRRAAATATYKTCAEKAAAHPSAAECRALAGLD